MPRFAAVMRAGSVVASLLMPASPGWARDVSFAEARAAAERAAPDVQLAEHRASVASTEVEVAGALANPTLTVTSATQTARLGTSVSVPLPLFGQRGTAIHTARADADAATLDIGVAHRESRWSATVAWIDLWETQERARLLGLAAKDADRLFQISSEKFDAGTGSRLDVVRTKADRGRALSEAEDAVLRVGAAAARLAPWMGVAPSTDLTAAGPLGYPATLAPLQGLESRLSVHPTLRRDKAQVTAAELRVQSEERLRWPLISPQLTVNQFDPAMTGPDFIFGLSIDVPVLDLRGGPIARARAQLALAEVTALNEERRLRADLLDAYRRTEGASAKLHALREQVLPAMKEARDMTEEGYQSGRVDLLRLLEAQRAFLDSRLAEVEAFAAWGRAVADLEKASGTDFQEGTSNAP